MNFLALLSVYFKWFEAAPQPSQAQHFIVAHFFENYCLDFIETRHFSIDFQ